MVEAMALEDLVEEDQGRFQMHLPVCVPPDSDLHNEQLGDFFHYADPRQQRVLYPTVISRCDGTLYRFEGHVHLFH